MMYRKDIAGSSALVKDGTYSGDNGTVIPTTTLTSSFVMPEDPEDLRNFYIGLFLAIFSSIFIGVSFILKKKALIRLAEAGCRAGEGGYGYLRDWMWWAGVISMGAGEACNFTAYAFAPASLVTPLGALSVLVTSVLSSRLLNEKLNLLGKIGCTMCLFGSTVIVIHSPKEDNVSSMQDLGIKMQDPVFVLYVAFVCISSIGLIYYVAPRYGQSNILVFIAICSIIGSLSVLGCKGLGLAIKETLGGDNQLSNGLTWFWLFSVVTCVTIQLNYLNKALDLFNTSMVTPIYYVFFTTFVILASGILFKEWMHLSPQDIIGNICGFAITVIGIFQMQLFRDVNVTLSQLRYLIWKRTDPTEGLKFDPLLSTYSDTSNAENGLKSTAGKRNSYTNRRISSWSDQPYKDDPIEDRMILDDSTEHIHSPNRLHNSYS